MLTFKTWLNVVAPEASMSHPVFFGIVSYERFQFVFISQTLNAQLCDCDVFFECTEENLGCFFCHFEICVRSFDSVTSFTFVSL